MTACKSFSLVVYNKKGQSHRGAGQWQQGKDLNGPMGGFHRDSGLSFAVSAPTPIDGVSHLLRPILDLRGLNKFLRPLRCKMLTVPRVRQAILQGNWFAVIDLEDAYFQIPIWEGHRHYLRFAFNGRTFEFCVLPFGNKPFTRCMDAVLGPLRH